MVEGDKEPLVPSDESGPRRRSFSDREGQKQELRGQQEGPDYGGKNNSLHVSFLFEMDVVATPIFI